MPTVSVDARYRALLRWLQINGAETANLPATYRELYEEALQRGWIRFHLLPLSDTEPFAIGTDFYGESLEEVIDAL